jgi:hypothetical protein
MIYRAFLIGCLALALPALAQQPQRYSCETTPAHRQFDFWLGNWEVTDEPGEKFYGRNAISKRENGCLLLEEYTTDKGFRGSSINYYNPVTGKWYQHWVDNGTSVIQTEGGMVDGSMVMEGSIYYMGSGQAAAFRARWTPLTDGRVRQFFEQKDEAGEWQTWFDGYYRRKMP